MKNITKAKDIKDIIAKHRAEMTFVHAESQPDYATLSIIIAYHAKISDKCVSIHFFNVSFALLFFSLLPDAMKDIILMFT